MVTKNADDDKAWVWESEIDSSSYSIREATDADGPPARGTKIVLSLKEGAEEVSLFLSLYVWASRLTACFIHSSRRVKN